MLIDLASSRVLVTILLFQSTLLLQFPTISSAVLYEPTMSVAPAPPVIGIPTAPTLSIIPTASTTATVPTTTTTTTTRTTKSSIPKPTKVPDNSTLITCPPPLIVNVDNLVSSSCSGNCCLPCPASTVFYEPDSLDKVYTIASVLRAISAGACAFLSGGYLVQRKRNGSQPSYWIVLVFAVLMVPYEGLGTMWLYKKEELLCESFYETATMSSSWLCALQGVALQYFALVMLLLALILGIHLHILTIYRSSWVQAHMVHLVVISFVLPWVSVIHSLTKEQIMYPGLGSTCFVGPDMADGLFFIPFSVLVCLAMCIHLGTIVYSIRAILQRKAGRLASHNHNEASAQDHDIPSPHGTPSQPQSQSQSQSQPQPQQRLRTVQEFSMPFLDHWRSGLFVICLLVVDMVWSLFHFVEAKKLVTSSEPLLSGPWFQDWVTCLSQQTTMAMNAAAGTVSLKNLTEQQIRAAVGEASQQACASVAQPFVPNIVAVSLKEILPAVLGIVILGIFGSRRELWHDLKTWWLDRRRARRRPRRRLWCGRSTDSSETGGEDDSKDQQDGYLGIHGDLTNAMSALAAVTKDDDSSYYGQNFRPKNLVLLPPLDISPSTTHPRDPNPLLLNYRPDTPEPWKPSLWLDSRSITTNGSDRRSAISQLKIDASPMSLTPAATSSDPLSPRRRSPARDSAPPPRRVYTQGDLEAGLTALDPHDRHLIVRTGSCSHNRGMSLPISGVYNNRYSDTGSDADSQVVVGEASRVLLNYRSNDDTRPQILTIDPTMDQQEPEQQEQQQSEQQPQGSLSPAPRKSQL
ncbi:MAG: hypothetical protein J3Q66DRAFT_355177 [Benniella sp.]|nr:MAG: hypothetical protein J3Q66DRAFT_355177 [Benniella sp.]